jgi:hypothetical protein
MRTVAVAGLLVLSPAGCSSGTCSDPDPQPRELTRPEVPRAADDAANLLVDISGALPESTRVTVTFEGDLALDVELPSASTACATDAVSRYGYRVDPGPVTVVVSTAGEQERLALTVRDQPRWVVVTVQDGFPLGAEAWHEQPAYG